MAHDNKGQGPHEHVDGPAPFIIAQTKKWRRDLDAVLQEIKSSAAGETPDVVLQEINRSAAGETPVTRSSRERSLAVMNIQEALMWLGMDLEDMADAEIMYFRGHNANSPRIDGPHGVKV